jgi:hypothetical protein
LLGRLLTEVGERASFGCPLNSLLFRPPQRQLERGAASRAGIGEAEVASHAAGEAAAQGKTEADAGNAHRATSREELLQWIWKVNPRHVQTRSVDMAGARAD